MKNLFALLCIPFFGLSQTTFTEHLIDTTAQTVGTKKIVPADFNKDGNIDIASINIGTDEIYGYPNSGLFTFGQRQILEDSIFHAADVCFADFNGNGWMDMAALSLTDKKLVVSFNQNGVYGNKKIVDSTYFFPVQVFAEDFTNDGFADILSVDDTLVALFVNDGLGNFTKHRVAGETEFYCAGIGDLNGDSLPDVLLGSVKLYTYINQGNGNFTRDTRNETLINQIITLIEVADVDADGDNDAAIYYTNTNSNIDWFANDSTGALLMGGTITNTADDVKSMQLADLTGNGLPDFVTAYGQTGKLLWIENLGAGNYGQENVLKAYSIINRAVAVADADNDGDMDIYCGHNFDGIFLWENNSVAFGLEENFAESYFYPNPTSGFITIQSKEIGYYSVYNLLGEKLVDTRELVAGKNQLKLDLNAGNYILVWEDGEQMFRHKLVVLK